MNTEQLRAQMKSAFRGVTLEGGISLRQGEICDNYGRDNQGRPIGESVFAMIPRSEVTDDWTALPLAELERYPYLSYLDAKGFRYYIPAFLLSLLEDASKGSMRVITTLASLRPSREHWSYSMAQYALLDETQRAAVATFLLYLQDDPHLDAEDQKLVFRALECYWQTYLP